MIPPQSSAELLVLMEQVSRLVLGPGYEWSDHVLRRGWIDHNLSDVTLRSDAPFHDVIVESFAHEAWSSGQLFKQVRDALLRARVDVDAIDHLAIVLRSGSVPAAWHREPNGEWFTRVEAEATLRLRDGAEFRQRHERDRLVPNVMLLAEGLDAQPRPESGPVPPDRL